MASGGNITRGYKAQKEMPIKERIYLYCRGRRNPNITGGWESKGYSNEINTRDIIAPSERVGGEGSWPNAGSWFIFPEPNASEQAGKCFVIGTQVPVNLDAKRYLVIEAKAATSGGTGLAVKLSRTKELDDDGLYIIPFNTTEYKKEFIDLRADGNITGNRYVVLTAGLNGWTTPSEFDIKRVYLTNEKEDGDIEITYNRGDNISLWENKPDGNINPIAPVFDTDHIEMYSADNRYCAMRTARVFTNLGNKRRLGILYNGIEINEEATSSLYFAIENADTGTNLTSAGNHPSTGLNTKYFGLYGYWDKRPDAGEYKIAIEVGWNSKIDILAVWLE